MQQNTQWVRCIANTSGDAQRRHHYAVLTEDTHLASDDMVAGVGPTNAGS